MREENFLEQGKMMAKARRKRNVSGSLRVDLGCGLSKTEGFVGVDRFNLPGVDVVCDLNEDLPFRDDSVDYVMASHSLEHVANLPSTMREIFRICKDRALVTIISPYHETSLNKANPYHLQNFNEHTARFFTGADKVPAVPLREYDFPHARPWGLIESDNTQELIDIRVLHLEYFYMPEFRGLKENEKSFFRRHLINVSDQMLIHAVVVKSPIVEDELIKLSETSKFEEPGSLRNRRSLEEEPSTASFLDDLVDRASGELRNRISELLENFPTEFQVERAERIALEDRLMRMHRDQLREESVQINELRERLELVRGQAHSDHAEKSELIDALRNRIDRLEANQYSRRELVERRFRRPGFASAIRELGARYGSLGTKVTQPLARQIGRVTGRSSDLSPHVARQFRNLLEAGILSERVTRSHQVVLSRRLAEGELIGYQIPSDWGGATGVEIAVSAPGLSDSTGIPLSYDLLDVEANQVLAGGTVVLTKGGVAKPILLPIEVPMMDEGQLHIRFACNTAGTADVRLFEWRRMNPVWRLLRLRSELFGRPKLGSRR
ncbi:MAG: methyltransferase domain-containing protein [Ensifer adhaerens]